MRLVEYLFVVLFASICVSCATPYQSHGLRGGHDEAKIDDDSYIVGFYGNGYISETKVWYFWFHRCAEFTLMKGYKYFTVSRLDRPAKRVDNVPKYIHEARIDMYEDTASKADKPLFEAQIIINELGPFVERGRISNAPARKDLVLKAMVQPSASVENR